MYYHKINAPFMRDMSKRHRPLVHGQWVSPEFEYLKDCQWEFTEKIDGSSGIISCINGQVDYHGRTNRSVIQPKYRDYLESPDLHSRVMSVAPDNGTMLVYGEMYGPGIQGGDKYRDTPGFIVFDVKIGDYWLGRTNVEDVANKLGLEVAPLLGYGTLQDAIDIVSSGITFDSNNKITRWGRGQLDSHFGSFEAEGIIARPVQQLFDRHGNRIITKIKGVDFKRLM